MRRVGVVVAVLIVAIVAGLLVGRRGAGGPAPADAVAAHDGGSPAGGPAKPDLGAARAAAVRAVSLTGRVVRAGLISRRDLILSVSTAGFGPRLADETSQAVDAMLLELGERDVDTAMLAVVEQPVTATAETNGGGVRVRVWSVLVVAAPGAGPARQVWRTVTLEMVDVDARWLVNGWSSTPGPTPAPAPETRFDDASVLIGPLGWNDTAANGPG
jgi:hypothetical protein